MTSLETSPFLAQLDTGAGAVDPGGALTERRASDMRGCFASSTGLEQAIDAGDPLIYQVSAAPVPERAGEVPFSITTIFPGHIEGEYYMTKGHGHRAHEGEVYTGLGGQGVLVLFDGHDVRTLDLLPDQSAYIPPGWRHRSVNVGQEPFRFLAVYPGAAGHDYDVVARHGMGARVIADGPGYRITYPSH